MRAALAQTLPDYMVPARFAVIEALPLTANGKVDIGALPDPADCAMRQAAGRRGPSSPTERRLLDIVVEVLGRADIGVDDDFFLLGGHSLLGTQLVIRARDAFGVELTLFHLFEGAHRRAPCRDHRETGHRAASTTMSDEEIRRMAAG